MHIGNLAVSLPALSSSAPTFNIWRVIAPLGVVILFLLVRMLWRTWRADTQKTKTTSEAGPTFGDRQGEAKLRPAATATKFVPARVGSTPSPSATDDDGFATSLAVGMATDNTLLGTAVGGSLTGAIVGVALDDMLTSQDPPLSDTAAPAPDPCVDAPTDDDATSDASPVSTDDTCGGSWGDSSSSDSTSDW